MDLTSSLAKRVLTALVLLPVAIGGILLLPKPWLALLFAAIVLIGADEWARLSGIRTPAGRAGYVALIALAMGGMHLLGGSGGLLFWLFALVALGWGAVTLFLLTRREVVQLPPGFRPAYALLGLFALVPAFGALVLLHLQFGPGVLLFLFVLIWTADSAAYFSGRRWGRVKLAPAISPGKTREGAYGALAGAALCAFFLAWLRPELASAGFLLLLCLVVTAISIVGDLFESLLKRQAGMKDSGTLLPGHGGVLDRIDSLTSAAPLFLLGLWLGDRL